MPDPDGQEFMSKQGTFVAVATSILAMAAAGGASAAESGKFQIKALATRVAIDGALHQRRQSPGPGDRPFIGRLAAGQRHNRLARLCLYSLHARRTSDDPRASGMAATVLPRLGLGRRR